MNVYKYKTIKPSFTHPPDIAERGDCRHRRRHDAEIGEDTGARQSSAATRHYEPQSDCRTRSRYSTGYDFWSASSRNRACSNRPSPSRNKADPTKGNCCLFILAQVVSNKLLLTLIQ